MLEEKLVGLRAELIDEESVEILCFGRSSVAATIGTKSGPVASPIIDYEITGDNLIIIGRLFPIIWENIEFGKGIITVDRNGKNAIYKITRKESCNKEPSY